MTTPTRSIFRRQSCKSTSRSPLKRFRAVYLQSALLETVRDMDIAELDKQLAEYVPGRLGDPACAVRLAG